MTSKIEKGKTKVQVLIALTILASLLTNWSMSSITGEITTSQISRNGVLIFILWSLYRGKNWARITWIALCIIGTLAMALSAGILFNGPSLLLFCMAFYVGVCIKWLIALFRSDEVKEFLAFRADSDPEKQPISDDLK